MFLDSKYWKFFSCHHVGDSLILVCENKQMFFLSLIASNRHPVLCVIFLKNQDPLYDKSSALDLENKMQGRKEIPIEVYKNKESLRCAFQKELRDKPTFEKSQKNYYLDYGST